jgi:hypothetical protein
MYWVGGLLEPLSSHGGQDIIAGALAAATGFSAHPAMLHVLCMTLALLTAESASPSAGFKSGPCHLRIESRLAGQDLTSSIAHVGAVEVETNATDQHLYVLLTEAGVGTSGTGLGAVEAGLDALHQGISVQRHLVRVRLDHFSSVGHGYSFLRVEYPYFLSKKGSEPEYLKLRSHRRASGEMKNAQWPIFIG